MQLLSELIEQAKRRGKADKEYQASIAKPVDEPWEKLKDGIDALDGQPSQVIANYLKLGTRYVKTDQMGRHHKGDKVCGDLKRITVFIAPLEGKSVEMIAYECKECGVYQAWYVVFDNSRNKCYQRMLIG